MVIKLSKDENKVTDNIDKNQDNILLTIKEVANILEETPNVVRNWIKELKDYIPLQKNESGYNVFDNEALEQMKLIKQLHREQNFSVKQIEHYFMTGGESYKPTPKKEIGEVLADELREIKEMWKLQQEFNKELLERLDQQQKYIDEKLEVRDQKLVANMKELLEQKQQKQLAASNEPSQESGEKEVKKSWWKFW